MAPQLFNISKEKPTYYSPSKFFISFLPSTYDNLQLFYIHIFSCLFFASFLANTKAQ